MTTSVETHTMPRSYGRTGSVDVDVLVQPGTGKVHETSFWPGGADCVCGWMVRFDLGMDFYLAADLSEALVDVHEATL